LTFVNKNSVLVGLKYMKKGAVSQGERPVDTGCFLKRNYITEGFSKDYFLNIVLCGPIYETRPPEGTVHQEGVCSPSKMRRLVKTNCCESSAERENEIICVSRWGLGPNLSHFPQRISREIITTAASTG
jgi:hypothetical protein